MSPGLVILCVFPYDMAPAQYGRPPGLVLAREFPSTIAWAGQRVRFSMPNGFPPYTSHVGYGDYGGRPRWAVRVDRPPSACRPRGGAWQRIKQNGATTQDAPLWGTDPGHGVPERTTLAKINV